MYFHKYVGNTYSRNILKQQLFLAQKWHYFVINQSGAPKTVIAVKRFLVFATYDLVQKLRKYFFESTLVVVVVVVEL